jgi:hypothetical protein
MVIPEPSASYSWSTFIQQNLYVLIGIIAIVFIVFYFVRIRTKKPTIISRNEIEKQKRIKELQHNSRLISEEVILPDGNKSINYREFKSLFHGIKFLGSITNIQPRISNPDKEMIYEIVFKPRWFLSLTNPFKKDLLRIFKDCLILDKAKGQIVIEPTVSIDSTLGYYYDVPNELQHLNWINEQIFKHDKEDNASFYFVESQKRATFDLDYAHDMGMKEKELQIELAKKRGKMTSI